MPGIQSQGFYDPTNRPSFPTSKTSFGSSGIGDILKMFKTGNPLIDIGSSLAGGIFGLLSGRTREEKNRQSIFDDLSRLKGRPAIDPRSAQDFIPQIEQSLIPLMNKLGRTRARRVGTSSGVGVGEALRQGQGQFGAQMLEIMRQIQQINARRPLEIAQAQARVA